MEIQTVLCLLRTLIKVNTQLLLTKLMGTLFLTSDRHPGIIKHDQSDTEFEDDLPSLERTTKRRRDLGREGNATRADYQVVTLSYQAA